MNPKFLKWTFKIISAITLVTALVFLCPNIARAESPVQPLQVVTYSDTSTQLRISGTAERLHYNVDSFQVVFTNPPNNYGTACTPVLVSFRFYNSSDLPAYVGQAEFEIVCTNGTGSTNLIIYGYDQISTDLFIAESSYSTTEVGRIGIGASNDFAYYTGFVVPPKTSLYFSAIVYVNASAYEGVSNVTGSQEQVNQLTMSSLNLYTNQISFSDAYPYHNEPIDFSVIIQSINDLSDMVSTSSEMQDLIANITYSGNNPSVISNSGTYHYVDKGDFSLSGLRVYVVRRVSQAIPITYDYEYNTTNDTAYNVSAYRYYYSITIGVFNSGDPIRCSYYNRMSPFPNNYYGMYVDNFKSDIYRGVHISSDHVELQLKIDETYSTGIIPNGNSFTYWNGYLDVYNANPVFPNIDLTNFFNYNIVRVQGYYPKDEYTILRDLYLAYSQVNGLDDSSDISSDVADVSDSNHIIEESYYSANASAIEATGLSNYRFSNEQNNGIGQVADDFMLLWNALGSWNGVYVFSLTMALATFIMRHGGLFTVKRQVSDKGGEGD